MSMYNVQSFLPVFVFSKIRNCLQVNIAQMTHFVFCVRYPVSSIGSTQLIIGLCVGLAIVPLTVAVIIIVCRKWKSRKTSHPKNRQNAKDNDVFIPDDDLDRGNVMASQPTPFYDNAITRPSYSSRGFEPVVRRMPAGSNYLRPTREMNGEYDTSISGEDGNGYYLETCPERIYANSDNERAVGPSRIPKFSGIVEPCRRISLYPTDDIQGTPNNDILFCRPSVIDRYPVNQYFENQTYEPRLN